MSSFCRIQLHQTLAQHKWSAICHSDPSESQTTDVQHHLMIAFWSSRAYTCLYVHTIAVQHTCGRASLPNGGCLH